MGRDFLNLKCLWIAHLMPSFLRFLDLYQETFELWRVGVRIDRGRRKLICRSECGLAFIFRDTTITPVNRHAVLVSFLAVDHHGLDAFGYHRFGDVVAARAGHLYLLAAMNSHLVGELRRRDGNS